MNASDLAITPINSPASRDVLHTLLRLGQDGGVGSLLAAGIPTVPFDARICVSPVPPRVDSGRPDSERPLVRRLQRQAAWLPPAPATNGVANLFMMLEPLTGHS